MWDVGVFKLVLILFLTFGFWAAEAKAQYYYEVDNYTRGSVYMALLVGLIICIISLMFL